MSERLPTSILTPPLPRPGDHALRREDEIRRLVGSAVDRKLYVDSYAGGLVTLREASGSVIDTPIAWLGIFPPQTGDAVVRLAIPGRGSREAEPTYVAIGPIHKSDDGPGVVEREASATAAVVASTGNTSTYVNAITLLVPVGPGVWDFVADGDLNLRHSASGDADVQIGIDGVNTPRATQLLSTSVWSRWGASRRQVAVAGNRSVAVTLDYKGRVSGTTSASNPMVRATAVRLA